MWAPALPELAKRRGRPKGSGAKAVIVKKSAPAVPAETLKRTLSVEGKARIAAAQKTRWAATKKVTKLAGMSAKKTAPAVIPASKAAKDVVKKASKKAAKTQPVKKSVAPAKKITQVKKAAAPQAESAVASV